MNKVPAAGAVMEGAVPPRDLRAAQPAAAPAPQRVAPRLARFAAVLTLMTLAIAGVLLAIFLADSDSTPADRARLATTLRVVFGALALVAGLAGWWIVTANDTRRAAQAESDRHTAELNAEIAAHKRTDVALKRAKEAAEAANLAKSRYLVGVSHEIRSPLNAIYGYAQLLERDADIAPQEAGSIIRRASEHLTNIVDGLLDISRIESGVLKLNRDVVPLPAFLESIVAMFRIEARNKGLAFHYRPAANLPAFVRTDEKRLRQILINLLSNAIKYTQEGSATLIVRYRGLVAEFVVADSGIGIAPEDIERIFEPFERGSAEAARAQPGTGLGLAITRVLAQVMGGDIAVASVPGSGSIFTLRLMLAEPGDGAVTTTRHRSITGYTGRRRTILSIDDDPLQLAVMEGLLRPLGFAVYAAANGPDGVDLAVRCAPDLVLLDIQLPGVSGWQVASQLRAIAGTRAGAATEAGARLKILMVSANAHEFAAGGDGGAVHDGFVTKPVELEALLDTMATQLGLDWETDAASARDAHAPSAELQETGISAVLPLAFAASGAPPARIAELRRLGQVGHLRGIEAALTALADEAPASRPLVDQLRGHVRAFDLGGYIRLLDAHG